MANISITRRCRRRCRYCFARHELARESPADMPSETYDAALAFLERSGIPEARLLGGEPTEHPRFCEYVTRARARGFYVVVFSGGMMPQPVLEFLAGLPASSVLVVLNAADPASDPVALVERQREVCRTLGAKVMLGVNVWSRGQDPAYLFEWIAAYGSCRKLRVGIAHPIWGGSNEFLRLGGPHEIPLFEKLVATGEARGVQIGFDCGFTPCMFSEGFVETHAGMFLAPEARQDTVDGQPARGASREGAPPFNLVAAVGVRCNPVIDILPEGDCIACYALSRFRRLPLSTGSDRRDLMSCLDGELERLLPQGIHRECAYCSYRSRGMCGGGCRARRALRLRPDVLIPLHDERAVEVLHA